MRTTHRFGLAAGCKQANLLSPSDALERRKQISSGLPNSCSRGVPGGAVSTRSANRTENITRHPTYYPGGRAKPSQPTGRPGNGAAVVAACDGSELLYASLNFVDGSLAWLGAPKEETIAKRLMFFVAVPRMKHKLIPERDFGNVERRKKGPADEIDEAVVISSLDGVGPAIEYMSERGIPRDTALRVLAGPQYHRRPASRTIETVWELISSRRHRRDK